MPNPYFEWAYDAGQVSPAQLVTTNTNALNALIDGTLSRNAYVKTSATTLNDLDVYPVIRVDNNPDPAFFERSSETTLYIAGDGGQLYEITGVYTELSLGTQKGNAFPLAQQNAVAFLNGGFFYDDGGGTELYDTTPELRSLYAEIGVEAVAVGGAFAVAVRDAGSGLHNFNSTKWAEAYTQFFELIVAANEEQVEAELEIVGALNLAEIEAALAAMSPPNNTL